MEERASRHKSVVPESCPRSRAPRAAPGAAAGAISVVGYRVPVAAFVGALCIAFAGCALGLDHAALRVHIEPKSAAWSLWKLASQLGESHWWFLLCAAVVWRARSAMRDERRPARLARWRDRRDAALFCMVLVAATGIAAILLKHGFGRARPSLWLEQGVEGFRFFDFAASSSWMSFPSGHTTTAFTLAQFAGLRWRRARVPALALALAIAASRVLVDRHWASDCVAGAALGIVMTQWLERHRTDLLGLMLALPRRAFRDRPGLPSSSELQASLRGAERARD